MSDRDDPDSYPGDEPHVSEPRSEGVRIIGAQEAAEVAGRTDVARRRRRGEKRYGDRPDVPEADADLPTVRISTSDASDEDGPGDHFGAVPVVRPRADEPRWADDSDDGRSYGHARAIPSEVEPDEPAVEDPGPADRASDEPASDEPAYDEPAYDEPAYDEPAFDDGGAEPVRRARGRGESRRDAPAYGDVEPVPAWDAAGGPGDQPGVGDPFEAPDDSFVLPHWTEPPTGQVPKVVIGDDAVDDDPTGTYSSAPRWRDEGERHVDTDFDDLISDAPRLGALGGEERPYAEVEDEFFDFGPEGDRDPLEAFAPEDELVEERRPRRRPPARRDAPGADDGGPPDDGGVGGDRDLIVAVGVGVALVAVGLLCFSLGGLATTLLACVVVGMAAYEFFNTVEARGFQPAGLLGLVATVGLMIATYTSGLNAYAIVLPLTVVLGLLWYLWVQPGEQMVRNLGVTLLGVMWIGFLGSFATLFLGLGKVIQDASGATSNIGIGVVIAAVIVTVSHDVGAYFIGRYFGKTALSAASPNKTLEGTVGGVLTAVVVTFIIVGVFGIAPIGGDIFRVFVFALLCAIVAPLGDLCESAIKRDLGIKDMGGVLPGHGGVLDRFDALLFVLPTAYFVTVLFGIW